MVKNKAIRFLRDFWPTMIVIGVILYATLASDPLHDKDLPAIPHLDKLIHAIMMGGLVGAIAFDIERKYKPEYVLNQRLMWLIFGAVAVFGLFDEILQGYMDNGRGCDMIDYCADLVGELVAVFTAPPAIAKVLKVNRPKS